MANDALGRQGFLLQRDNVLDGKTTTTTGVRAVEAADVVFPADPERAANSTGMVEIGGTWDEDRDLAVVVRINDQPGSSRRVSTERRAVGNGSIEQTAVDNTVEVQTIRLRLIDTGVDTERATAYFEGIPIEVTDAYVGDAGNLIRIEVDTSGLVISAEPIASAPEALEVDDDLVEGRAWEFGSVYPLSTSGLIHPDSQRITFDRGAGIVYRRYIERDGGKTLVRFTPPIAAPVEQDDKIYGVTGEYTVRVIYEEVDGAGDPIPGSKIEEVYTGITVFDILSGFLSSALIRPAAQLLKNRRPGGVGALDVNLRSNQAIISVDFDGQGKFPGALADVTLKSLETELITIERMEGEFPPNAERWEVTGSVSGDLGYATTGQPKSTAPLDFTIPPASNKKVTAAEPPSIINTNYQAGGSTDLSQPTIDPETEEETPGDPDFYSNKEPDICIYRWSLGAKAKSDTLTFTYMRPAPGGDDDTTQQPSCDCRTGQVSTGDGGGGGPESGLDVGDYTVMTDSDYATRVQQLAALAETYIGSQQNDNLGGRPAGDRYDITFIESVIAELRRGLSIIISGADTGSSERTAGLAAWDAELTRIQAGGDGTLSNLGALTYTASVTDPANYYYFGASSRLPGNVYYSVNVGTAIYVINLLVANNELPRFHFKIEAETTGYINAELRITEADVQGWIGALVSNTTTGAGVGATTTDSLTEYDGSTGNPSGNSMSVTVEYLGASPPQPAAGGTAGAKITSLTELTTANETVLKRVVAGMRDAIAKANIDPFDDALDTDGEGDGPDLSQPHWRVKDSNGRHYVEMMAPTATDPVGRPYTSRRREWGADGKQKIVDADEWTFTFIGGCLDLLRPGDEFQVKIVTANQQGSYAAADTILVRTIGGRPLLLQGGIDGDNTHTWAVLGEDEETRPNYEVIDGAETTYQTAVGAGPAVGIDFLIRRGTIANQLNDEWLLYVQGGQYELSVDGGDTFAAAADIPQAPVTLTGSLTLAFIDGPGASFEDTDRFAFEVRQPGLSSHLITPDEETWRPPAGAQSVVVDFGADTDIEALALLRFAAPTGRVVSLKLLDAGDSVVFAAPDFVCDGGREPFFSDLGGQVTARKLQVSVDDGEGVSIAWVWAGLVTQLSVDADSLVLRRERLMARASGPNSPALAIGQGQGAQIGWSYDNDATGGLSVADDLKAQAMYRALTDAGDGWVGFVPNLGRSKALLSRWSEDSLEIEDRLSYNADLDEIEQRQMSLRLVGVLG